MTMGGGRIGTASLGALTGAWAIVKSACTHLDMPGCYLCLFSMIYRLFGNDNVYALYSLEFMFFSLP